MLIWTNIKLTKGIQSNSLNYRACTYKHYCILNGYLTKQDFFSLGHKLNITRLGDTRPQHHGPFIYKKKNYHKHVVGNCIIMNLKVLLLTR